MAAIAVTNQVPSIFGNRRAIFANVTSIDNNDTWATGLQAIDFVGVGPTAAGAGTQIGYTVSGGTITFKVESGSLAAQLMVIGT